MTTPTTSSIVLSAGGTGGHLFPAQALAGELVRRGKTIVVDDGSPRHQLMRRRFPARSSRRCRRRRSPTARSWACLRRRSEILAGIVSAWTKLARIKPGAVIGFGGYPSLPVMIAAWLGHWPTAILEQNAVTGRANRAVMNRQ